MESRRVGVLGGGQLGRMFVEAASRLNVDVLFLDQGTSTPAKQIKASPDHVDGSFADREKIKELAAKVNVLTVEIEHVDAAVLAEIEAEGKVAVHPRPETIRIIQDKYAQKLHLASSCIPLAESIDVEASEAGIRQAGDKFGYPFMLKSRTLAYDGRGNFVVKSSGDASSALAALGGGQRGLYAERWAKFEREVAVMVVRSAGGEVRSYPAVETVHKDSICHQVIAPLRSRFLGVQERARKIAEDAVRTFEGAGVFGVEMFLMADGTLLLNEIAPRPHNSGHYTIEACSTSQYENHLRAILNLPLGDTSLKVPSAAMLNILGLSHSFRDAYAPALESLRVPGATVHLYGKAACRKGRKMGHVTVVADCDAQLEERMKPLLEALDKATLSAAGAASDLSSSTTSATTSHGAFNHPHPLVGIIMGSDSDLPTMLPAATFLKNFSVPFELTIVSAHRTPDRMVDYARSAAARGLKVIIAGAGGAAHLPGMVAAMTPLPVVGVPVRGSSLDGVDSLHSIVQMPRGVPVATVAINNSTNAGLLAIRILGSSMPRYLTAMEKYMEKMEREVLDKAERLEKEAWDYEVKK